MSNPNPLKKSGKTNGSRQVLTALSLRKGHKCWVLKFLISSEDTLAGMQEVADDIGLRGTPKTDVEKS
jgi:hypothetical protein